MSDPNPSFTFCEVRIISLIKQGLSNMEIANELSIEVTTVKTHRKNILKKMGLRGKTAFMQFVFLFIPPKSY